MIDALFPVLFALGALLGARSCAVLALGGWLAWRARLDRPRGPA
jgi:hypothetical protein